MPETQTSPETLSGQQVQAMRQQFAGELQKILAKLELRQKALDQACRMAEKPGAPGDVIDLANQMFEFLTSDVPAA